MTTKTGIPPDKGREGFTLVEAMLAVFVLSIAAAGVLLPFVSGATVRAEGARRTLAAGLASDLMEQILRRPFHDPSGVADDYRLGPEAGDFDNIDDFHGYAESEGQVKDAMGAVFTDPRYANFSRNVTCEYVYVPPQPVESDPTKCEFIRITVQVNYSGKQMATIVRLVSE
ncbi:MAG TPA: prepilin-type N-terminal cleavage/methylation domain-containing protein [Sedimentisphaerales bacterium]|nr:prepilin-type N-terminal cleavage/methylation domain-containing protein [Sedimentisphaerales bacterium]